MQPSEVHLVQAVIVLGLYGLLMFAIACIGFWRGWWK